MELLCFNPGREYLPLIFLSRPGENGSRREPPFSFCSLFVLLMCEQLSTHAGSCGNKEMQAAPLSNPVPLSSFVPAALLHILHLCCPAELFTCSIETTWLWPIGPLASLASPEDCKGYVCPKACVGRQNEEQKEGRLSFLQK